LAFVRVANAEPNEVFPDIFGPTIHEI